MKFLDKVVTVLGEISSSELGITMPHEHLLCDLTHSLLVKPQLLARTTLVNLFVSIEILGDLKRDIEILKDNMQLFDFNDAIAELRRYKRAPSSK